MAEISYEYIKITGDLGYFGISERVNVTLNSLPIITLSDHIAFAIECKKIYQSSYLPNIRLFFRRACPRTVLFGEIKEKFGVEFNGNKAGFIAMHIINARMGTNMGQIPYITKTINGCMEITDTFYLFGKN
jgi:beta-glucoside operon transcriptional antiterminator